MKRINLNISTRFGFFLGIILLFVILIIFLLNRSIGGIQNFDNYNLKVKELVVEYLTMRRFEQHFLLRHAEDESFYKTGKNRYLRKHAESFNRFNNKIKLLQEEPLTAQLKLSDNLEKLSSFNKSYENIFTQIAQKLYQRGSINTGLIGEMELNFEESVQNMQNIENKNLIYLANTQLKNYLYTKDKNYSERFQQYFNELSARMGVAITGEELNFIDTTLVDHGMNELSKHQKLIFNLNEYKKNYNTLIKLDNQIGLNANEGLQSQLRTEINKFDPEIESLSAAIKKGRLDIKNNSLNIAYVLIGLILLIVLIYIIQFARSITKPINKLVAYILPLSKGVLPDKSLVLKRKNEFYTMASAINDLIEGLKKVTQFSESIGKGTYDLNFEPLSQQDDLGNSLIEMRNNLIKAKEEEGKRQHEDDLRKWSNEGLAQFNELLRQSAGNIDELTGKIVQYLVNFLEANQAGLFLLNDLKKEDIHLELVATYAYNHERKKQKKIYMGEGLVGMCAVEKATVYLNDIPKGYLSIGSGLGGASPKSLLIVPLKLENEIFGVIEIASFKKFEKHEIAFIERVSESIASTLSLAKINTRTALLLEKSQRQAEEMASQEEEMRQNLEELQATQEESTRREAEKSSLLNAINSSSLVIEFDLNGYIINANDPYLELLQLNRSEMIGKHQSDFEKMDEKNIHTEEFWDRLRKGEIISQVNSIMVSGEIRWLHQVNTPILDAEGKPYKILNLATDITESKNLETDLIKQTEIFKLQEDELRKNLEELETTQIEMKEKQKELEETKTHLKEQEKILKDSISKAKETEHKLRTQNAALVEREDENKKNEKEWQRTLRKIKIENEDYEANHKKLEANEKILKKFLKESKDKQKQIDEKNMELTKNEQKFTETIEELNQAQAELKQKIKQLESEVRILKDKK